MPASLMCGPLRGGFKAVANRRGESVIQHEGVPVHSLWHAQAWMTLRSRRLTFTMVPFEPRAMADDETDPVKAAFDGELDLYDIATWDVRSRLDAVSLWLYSFIASVRPWVLEIVALALFLTQLAVAGSLVIDQPRVGILALLSAVPALLLAGYFWYLDPTRREPIEPLAVTFLLGVLFAGFAAVLNTLLFPVFGSLPTVGLLVFFFVVVGPIEETVKWLAVKAYAYDTDSFNTIIDGVIYGAVAGLGFATIENFTYIVQSYLLTAGGEAPQIQYTIQTATQRAFVGPGHVIYSAFAGYYLGLAKYNSGNWGPIAVKGLLVATFIHASYNVLVSYLPLTVPAFVVFVVVYDGFWLGILYSKVRRYGDLYRAATSQGEQDGATP
jgi:RsiW-degrading membrane proteinase PrsW (M82 family)